MTKKNNTATGKTKSKKTFKNYIFDLYGTLLDISTDEHKNSLWKLMAQAYNAYGCEWTPKRLHDAFFKADSEERVKLKNKTGFNNPEIKLEKVFARMLFEAPAYHESGMQVDVMDENAGLMVRATLAELKDYIAHGGENELMESFYKSSWVTFIANLFRIYSRKYFRPYRNTFEFLDYLKNNGKGIYLLSNAQAVFTMPEIEESGLLEYFDRIYISSDLEMMKPQKEFMEELLAGEGLDRSECVMVGNDVNSDIRIAVRCGMNSILLNTFGLKEAELKKQIRDLLAEEKAGRSLAPKIVMSGDIGELM